ncbi:sucrose phosphorylase [Arenicella xantha]|uniref:Sucrose phosphorylase n=1 Tax=Arenicella xantha TaxID=644221 RepID=A0A395JPA7_9GAMM|nr:sucrose phosphorylase [Arenicella xantha]RBP53481.1 sucrose phosphorylase [Arenicella xantha]
MQLITYVDRLAGDLAGLKSMLDKQFSGLFSGVHLLPFFDPIDGADAGFDPVDHTAVDGRLGGWPDVAELGADYSVMADLIVNHVSAESAQFKDVLQFGKESKYWDLFLKKSDVFPVDGNPNDVAKIYRPRPSSPFTSIAAQDGHSYEFWTTFSENQIDINVEVPTGQAYLTSVLDQFASSGVKEIRLDAAGYAIKRAGTRCFMLPETFEFIASLTEAAKQRGMQTLVEIHSHYRLQIEIARRVGRVYDFALPPLVLNAIYQNDAAPLKRWLEMSPRNCVTVLDTHDGIGILDVARDGDKPGLLSDDRVNELVEGIHQKSGGESREASGTGASNLDIYQVNCTFYDALGRCDADYLIARAIQFFAPGEPQLYYVGLLAGMNDMALLRNTGVGRDINRQIYSSADIEAQLARPVVASLMALIKLRNTASAFDGEFSLLSTDDHTLGMKWSNGGASAMLTVYFKDSTARILVTEGSDTREYDINEGGFHETTKR